jgi:hypothetical protein
VGVCSSTGRSRRASCASCTTRRRRSRVEERARFEVRGSRRRSDHRRRSCSTTRPPRRPGCGRGRHPRNHPPRSVEFGRRGWPSGRRVRGTSRFARGWDSSKKDERRERISCCTRESPVARLTLAGWTSEPHRSHIGPACRYCRWCRGAGHSFDRWPRPPHAKQMRATGQLRVSCSSLAPQVRH